MRTYLFVAFLTAMTVSPTSAALTLVGYDTTNPNGANGAPSPDLPVADSASFLTPLDLSRGSGLTPNVGIAFNSRDWSLADSLDLSSDKYIQWGWSTSTQSVDLTDLQIQYDRSGDGPTQLAIAISVDGGAFQSVFSDSDVDASDETHTIDLTSFDSVQQATFRLFGFDATSGDGTMDIEEIIDGGRRGIIVRGELTSVPEPTSVFLLGMISCAATLRRRRRI